MGENRAPSTDEAADRASAIIAWSTDDNSQSFY